MGILRLAHVDTRTPDLELSTAYYTEIIGMNVVERTGDEVYLKCWDEETHHSLRLRYNARTGMDLFSFLVETEDDLHDLERKVERYGCPVTRVSKGESVGQGESLRFEIPSGQTMELVADLDKPGGLLGKRNPAPVPPPGMTGIAPPRIDHMLINAEEVGEAHAFFTQVLGFRLTEQLLDANGHKLGVWLERSHSPHDIAIVNGPNGALHHFAFWLDDWDHVRKAADILAFNGVQIDQGPTRHGVTRGNTVYFFDPLGVRNEVFTGGYQADPDFPTITWTEDNFGKGLFYYENVISQRFLRMHT
ncbi:MAG: catechol 2,3-dioxygenase [Pseudonocardiaceae bacterium]|nr:catechol 2,3-dioxygenase [Pseudonocardiaceae bacterium]